MNGSLKDWIKTMVLVFSISLMVVCTIEFFNLIRQRFYCELPWNDCNPLELIPCEPKGKMLKSMRYYERKAAEYQIDQQVDVDEALARLYYLEELIRRQNQEEQEKKRD